MPGAIYRLKKNIAGKMSGVQNMAISLIWMPAVPVLSNEKAADAALLPYYRCPCLFDFSKDTPYKNNIDKFFIPLILRG